MSDNDKMLVKGAVSQMKACRKCGSELHNNSISLCGQCEAISIIDVITRVSNEKRGIVTHGGKRQGAGRKASRGDQ